MKIEMSENLKAEKVDVKVEGKIIAFPIASIPKLIELFQIISNIIGCIVVSPNRRAIWIEPEPPGEAQLSLTQRDMTIQMLENQVEVLKSEADFWNQEYQKLCKIQLEMKSWRELWKKIKTFWKR